MMQKRWMVVFLALALPSCSLGKGGPSPDVGIYANEGDYRSELLSETFSDSLGVSYLDAYIGGPKEGYSLIYENTVPKNMDLYFSLTQFSQINYNTIDPTYSIISLDEHMFLAKIFLFLTFPKTSIPEEGNNAFEIYMKPIEKEEDVFISSSNRIVHDLSGPFSAIKFHRMEK